MKKLTFCLIIFLGSFLSAKAQSFSVQGNVADENGMPLLGVNVLVKDASRGTTTDFDGNFSLTGISPVVVFQFSYLGFLTREVSVKDDRFLRVTLMEDSQALEEVVVGFHIRSPLGKTAGFFSKSGRTGAFVLQP